MQLGNPVPGTGDQLAVVSQSGPTVSFFDAVGHELLDVLEVAAEPHELCFDPDSRLLYCTTAYRSGYYHANSGRARELTVIDPDARRVVEVLDLAPEHAPHGLALDRARGRLYVSVEATEGSPGGVVVIDTARREELGRIDTGAPGPHWFSITPDGALGYAANKEAPFVSVVDLDSGELVGRIEVPGSEGIAVSPDGSTVAVAAPYGDLTRAPSDATGVRLIDVAAGQVTRVLGTDNLVYPVHITATGLLLAGELVMDRSGRSSALGAHRAGQLSVFALPGGELLGTIEVGRFPLTITASPDGARGYVAAVLDSTVTVVDLHSLEVLDTLRIDRAGEPGAHGLAYIPAANPR
jgi:DNA-binding beta-propeller fold protein YncE